MTQKKIKTAQNKIQRTMTSSLIHPDNPLAYEMTKRYRELEEMEEKK